MVPLLERIRTSEAFHILTGTELRFDLARFRQRIRTAIRESITSFSGLSPALAGLPNTFLSALGIQSVDPNAVNPNVLMMANSQTSMPPVSPSATAAKKSSIKIEAVKPYRPVKSVRGAVIIAGVATTVLGVAAFISPATSILAHLVNLPALTANIGLFWTGALNFLANIALPLGLGITVILARLRGNRSASLNKPNGTDREETRELDEIRRLCAEKTYVGDITFLQANYRDLFRLRELFSKHHARLDGQTIEKVRARINELVDLIEADSDQLGLVVTMRQVGPAGTHVFGTNPGDENARMVIPVTDVDDSRVTALACHHAQFLGSGKTAEVFTAYSLASLRDLFPNAQPRRVAIKIIKSSVDLALQADVRASVEQRVSNINHQNVIKIHGVGEIGTQRFIVMEYIEGTTLERLAGHVTPKELIGIIIQILEGLREAHRLGIYHRDLKLENVFRTNSGRIVIADFGMAKITNDLLLDTTMIEVTTLGDIPGTFNYIPPEAGLVQSLDSELLRVIPPVDVERCRAAWDLYAVGCIAYRLLAGIPPRTILNPQTFATFFLGYILNKPNISANDQAGYNRIQSRQISFIAYIKERAQQKLASASLPEPGKANFSDQFWAVVSRLLAYDASLRYQDCGTVITALKQVELQLDTPGAAVPAGVQPPAAASAPSAESLVLGGSAVLPLGLFEILTELANPARQFTLLDQWANGDLSNIDPSVDRAQLIARCREIIGQALNQQIRDAAELAVANLEP
jgi:serine/threonine protein kinase